MNKVKIARNCIFGALLCLIVVQITLIMPPYFACRNAFEGEMVSTFWGSYTTCHGESTDMIFGFYQLFNIGIVMLLVLFVSFQILLTKKDRSKPKTCKN
ncbi:hypothetical protein ACFSQ3_05685 [Sphingobacterium corticis]|uniref:Uncharacterized protein n=1 Tax=Sphingobacterium corticis TaxID=1812823 RepID=A0ABW5NIL9_9SPHI